MTGFVDFIDITGDAASRAPLVRGGLRGYYVTGTGGVEETAAQISAAEAAGMTVLGIDQTPGLTLFRAGRAEIADIEALAGTDVSAEQAVKDRITLGIRLHTLYVSLSALPPLRLAVAGLPGVMYGVANYGWSAAEAEAYLDATLDAAYAQFGDPASNPGTLVPGTNVTLAGANADIDVATAYWAAQFLPDTPAPAAAAPSTWQEAMMQALPEVRQGATGEAVRTVQGLAVARGHVITVDGVFGPLTKTAVEAVQSGARIGVDGICGPQTWPALLGV